MRLGLMVAVALVLVSFMTYASEHLASITSDVGGVYDPENERYDHHQKGFTQLFGHGFNTKLSSAGLLYKHYGLEVIAMELQLDQNNPDVYRLFLAVYKNFIEFAGLVFYPVSALKRRRRKTDSPPLGFSFTEASKQKRTKASMTNKRFS